MIANLKLIKKNYNLRNFLQGIIRYFMIKFIKAFPLILLFSLFWLNDSDASSRDFCLWTDFNFVKKIRSNSFSVYSEFYTKNNSSRTDRISIGFRGEHVFSQRLSGGIGYSLLNFNRTGYHELVDRFYLQLEPSFHLAKIYFTFRERMQITLFPETRTNVPTTYYWRNRLELAYKNADTKLEPLTSLEAFCHLGNTDHNRIDEFRYILGTNYHLTVKQKIKLYGMLTNGTIVNRFIVGISYEFKL